MRIPSTLLPRQAQVNSTIAVDFIHPKIEIEDLYLFPITVSNPAVSFRTIISNRDSQTWVPLSAACDYTGNDSERPWNAYLDNCADGQRLDPATSTTIKQSSSGVFSLPGDVDLWPMAYNATGGTGSDTVNIGGVELTQFDMNFATGANTSFGQVGLGKDSNLLDRLVKEGHIAARAFSMFQGSDVRYTQNWDPDARDADYPGSIVLGGYDFAKEGDAYMRGDLDANGIPQFYVTGLNVHSPDVHVILDGSTSYDAEIDTTDPWIHVPRSVAESIRSVRSNTYNDAGVITSTPIHQGNITMKVRLKGTSARVGVQEFNVSLPESIWEFDRSYLAAPKPTKKKYSPPFIINYSTSHSKIILGRPFLKAIYLAINYDSNEFQIAPASYSAETEILPFAAVSADKSNRYDSFPTRSDGSVAPSTQSLRGSGATETTAAAKPSTPTAAIAGGTVGGIVALVAIVGLILFFLRKKKRSWVETSEISYPIPPSTSGITPATTASEQEAFFKPELPATEAYTQKYDTVGELPASPTNITQGYYHGPEPEPQEVPASPVIPGMGVHVPKPEQAVVPPHEPHELP